MCIAMALYWFLPLSTLRVFLQDIFKLRWCKVITCFLKVVIMPLHFYERPVFIPIFTNQKKSKEDFSLKKYQSLYLCKVVKQKLLESGDICIFLWNVSSHLLTNFNLIFMLLQFVCYLFILDTSPLSDTWFLNIFSHAVPCLFILITWAFTEYFLI